MKFNKMNIYRLKRSKLIDKNGRPAIFLDYFGEQSLVWCGTTVKRSKSLDKPLIIDLNNTVTYFYNHNIEKVLTKDLIANWTIDATNKTYKLSEKDEKVLISKFLSFTNQKNPYEKIILLELELQNLKKEQEKNKVKEIEKILEKDHHKELVDEKDN